MSKHERVEPFTVETNSNPGTRVNRGIYGDRTQAIKQLNEAVKEMARQMLGQGEQIEWTLDIKSMSSKKENVHLNGPMEL